MATTDHQTATPGEGGRLKKPRFAVWGGRMNLLKAGGAALDTTSFASGYLTRRRAHHETSRLAWV